MADPNQQSDLVGDAKSRKDLPSPQSSDIHSGAVGKLQNESQTEAGRAPASTSTDASSVAKASAPASTDAAPDTRPAGGGGGGGGGRGAASQKANPELMDNVIQAGLTGDRPHEGDRPFDAGSPQFELPKAGQGDRKASDLGHVYAQAEGVPKSKDAVLADASGTVLKGAITTNIDTGNPVLKTADGREFNVEQTGGKSFRLTPTDGSGAPVEMTAQRLGGRQFDFSPPKAADADARPSPDAKVAAAAAAAATPRMDAPAEGSRADATAAQANRPDATAARSADTPAAAPGEAARPTRPAEGSPEVARSAQDQAQRASESARSMPDAGAFYRSWREADETARVELARQLRVSGIDSDAGRRFIQDLKQVAQQDGSAGRDVFRDIGKAVTRPEAADRPAPAPDATRRPDVTDKGAEAPGPGPKDAPDKGARSDAPPVVLPPGVPGVGSPGADTKGGREGGGAGGGAGGGKPGGEAGHGADQGDRGGKGGIGAAAAAGAMTAEAGDRGGKGASAGAGGKGGGLELDFGDKKTRELMLDVLRRMLSGKLEGLDEKGQKLHEALKQLDPEKLAQIKQLLASELGTDKGGKPGKPEDAAQRAGAEKGTEAGKGSKADGGEGGAKTSAERLIDFFRANKDLLDKGMSPEKASPASLLELGKIIKDLSKEAGVDLSKSGLNLKEALSKGLEAGLKPGEQGTLPGDKARQELAAFFARLSPEQEALIRAALTRVEDAGKRPEAARPEPAKAEAAVVLPQKPAETGVKAEGGARAEGGTKAEAGGKELSGKAEAATAAASAAQAGIEAAAAGRAGQRGEGQKDADALATGLKDDKGAKFEEDRKGKKPEDETKGPDRSAQDAALAALADRKIKEEEEKTEKEQVDEKDKKKEPEGRQKYIVRERDTLESIASRMLRDSKLAALIYEINKSTIPTVIVNGRSVLNLRPKLVLWLPSPADIEEFRGRLFAGGTTKFEYAPQFKTPEEELAARFGQWEGAAAVKAAESQSVGPPAGDSKDRSAERPTAEATAASQARRQNVENVLGPLSAKKEEAGRLKYLVRLGDTLKSVAMRHPALQDVALWKLLAEVNQLSAEADAKGTPVATLKRGSTLFIPAQQEIEAYRERNALAGPVPRKPVPVAAAAPTKLDIATKPCPSCGRMTTLSAEICPGCAYSFEGAAAAKIGTATATGGASGESEEQGEDATLVVLAAAGLLPKTPATAPPAAARDSQGSEEEGEDATQVVLAAAGLLPKAAPKTDAPAAPPPGPVPPPEAAATGSPASALEERAVQHLIEQLGESCRLVKSVGDQPESQAGFKARLEVCKEDAWLPVVSYEIYDDVSLRHEYMLGGKRRTVRIDLPPSAVHELAENDLSANWRSYCEKFLTGKSLSD